MGWRGRHRITRHCAAIGSFLLTCATTGVSLIVVWFLSGAPPRGQPWTPAVTLPPGRDGLSVRRMVVLWTFREPSLGRHVHGELRRSALLDMISILSATACHQRNDVERYSRFIIPNNLTMPQFATKPRWARTGSRLDAQPANSHLRRLSMSG